MKIYDIIILGGGASGLFAAAYAVKHGFSVAIIDMGGKLARKVAVSGGGRCNFTNTAVAPDCYFGNNTNFVRGALARFTPNDMLEWARAHKLKIVEKARGQYFCENGANSVVQALISDTRGTDIFTSTNVVDVEKNDNIFTVKTNHGSFACPKLIVATGGTSFETVGVSDIGHKIAKKFGHKIVPVRPALCAIATHAFSDELMGISLPVAITVGRTVIRDDMLFTHFGIGGPAVYRTTVRDIDKQITINLCPDTNIYDFLRQSKQTDGKKTVATILSQKLPVRVAKWIGSNTNTHIADLRDSDLKNIANRINNIVIPSSDIKYHNLASAEVVRGGVDTADISSKTMESKLCSGLYFIGEVLDIAGDLGGFNLHWAWASGFTAGNAI
ncbi:MAG: aminoacetone oxidase family FAD-binding enzyme [Alphaproteobacteria bacterium]|nr:aminoacetone oxidase family FAD-binding enzyme [Alphaproteobacteria bacterium]